MGADAAPHAPAGAMSTTETAPAEGRWRDGRRPPCVRPPDDREKRKRNLVIIAAVLFVLVVATAVEVGSPAPGHPGRVQRRRHRAVQPEPDRLPAAPDPPLPEPRQALVRAPQQGPRAPGSRPSWSPPSCRWRWRPAILIFLIASNLINTSIEGWFKIQVERPLDESMRVAQTFYERVQDEAVRHGQYVARDADPRRAPARGPARGSDRVPPGAGRAVRAGRHRALRRRAATRSCT